MLQSEIDEINKQFGLMGFSKPSKTSINNLLVFFVVFIVVAILLKLLTKQTKVMILVYSLVLALLTTLLYSFRE